MNTSEDGWLLYKLADGSFEWNKEVETPHEYCGATCEIYWTFKIAYKVSTPDRPIGFTVKNDNGYQADLPGGTSVELTTTGDATTDSRDIDPLKGASTANVKVTAGQNDVTLNSSPVDARNGTVMAETAVQTPSVNVSWIPLRWEVTAGYKNTTTVTPKGGGGPVATLSVEATYHVRTGPNINLPNISAPAPLPVPKFWPWWWPLPVPLPIPA